MSRKTRWVLSIILGIVCSGIIFVSNGWDAFVAQLNREPLDINELELSDVEIGRAVTGECYFTYGAIGYIYNESTNTYTGKKTQSNYNYVFLVDCGANDVMLLQTNNKDGLTDRFFDMSETYLNSETIDDYYMKYPFGTKIDGVFIKNDPEFVSYYNEFYETVKDGEGWENVQLAPYTLDCTETYDSRVKDFYIGCGLIAVLTVLLIVILVSPAVRSRSRAAASYGGAPAMNYGNTSGGYDDVYSSGNRNSFDQTYGTNYSADQTAGTTPQGFAPQSQTGYQQQTGFQSQGFIAQPQANNQYQTGYQSQGVTAQPQGNNQYQTSYQSQGFTAQPQANSQYQTGYQSPNSGYTTPYTGYGSSQTNYDDQ